MELVFKILKDRQHSIYDSMNIRGYVIMSGSWDVKNISLTEAHEKVENMKKGIALMLGIMPDLVHTSTMADLLGFQSAGLAKPRINSHTPGGTYGIIESNGKIPKTRPGRKAEKIDKGHLAYAIRNSTGETDVDAGIRKLVLNNAKVKKDLQKISVDFENIESSPNGTDQSNSLLGLHTINGFSFVGCYAHGDWEHPVFFIVYHDGKSFRAYVPNHGNVYNPYTKAAFGNEETDDAEAKDLQWLQENFPGKYDDLEEGDFEWTMLEDEGVDFDWDILRNEIETRIIVS